MWRVVSGIAIVLSGRVCCDLWKINGAQRKMEERNSSDWQADSTLVSLLEAISEAHISHRSRYRIVRIVRASYYTAIQQYICVVHLGIQLGNHTSPPFTTEYSNQQWNCTSIKCSSQHSYQNVQSIYIRGWTTVLTLPLAVHPTNKHQSTITLAKDLLSMGNSQMNTYHHKG